MFFVKLFFTVSATFIKRFLESLKTEDDENIMEKTWGNLVHYITLYFNVP